MNLHLCAGAGAISLDVGHLPKSIAVKVGKDDLWQRASRGQGPRAEDVPAPLLMAQHYGHVELCDASLTYIHHLMEFIQLNSVCYQHLSFILHYMILSRKHFNYKTDYRTNVSPSRLNSALIESL